MGEKKSDQEKELRRIGIRFAGFRRRRGGRRPHYPPDLRELVRLAAKQGITSDKLATAAGVTTNSIHNWVEKTSGPEPRELILRETLLGNEEAGSDKWPLARIVLPSGSVIEIAADALTPRLIAALSVGGRS